MAGNVVKQAARSGARIRGVHLTFAAPAAIEVLAGEVDFVYLDGEHGCFTPHDIETACLAAERWGLAVIARVPDNTPPAITAFLDRGVRGIVVPHIDSVADARAAVAATYFAPLGDRSFGGGRPAYLAIEDRVAHLAERNADTSLCLMIESRAGLEAAGELARVEGVDYLSFGPMDLAQALGHAGEPGHADCKRAVAEATREINAAGKRVREDFMNYAWINEILMTGARQLLGAR
jgi:2-keto-3-deoxy-L-rhamnonate aldolase RhmA